MDPFTIAMFAGAGLQAYGQYQSGQASAAAASVQARIKNIEANEMVQRLHIQQGRLLNEGEGFKSQQNLGYAHGGVQLGSGATLVAMEDTNMKITQQLDDLKRDTIFKANQLRMGAGFEETQGSNYATAGAINAGGSLLEGYTSYKKYVD